MTLPLFLTRLLAKSGLARFLPGMYRKAEGAVDFLHHYSDLVLSAPRADLVRAAALIEPPSPDTIDLSLGTPRFDPGVSVSARVSSADRRGLPPLAGLVDLRSAIAERLLAEHQVAVNPVDEVLVTSGAAGAFHSVLDAFVNRGDRVVLFDPCSPLYPLALRSRGARINWLFSWVENGRLRFRLPDLQRALRRARLLVLSQPSNPTGGMLAAEDLEQLAWWADRHDVLIVSDHTFDRFVYEGDRVSIGSLPRAQRRTLTLGSVSKSHALASLRVGWLAGHRHLVRPCLLTAALRSPFVPTICQQIALSALVGRISNPSYLAEFAGRRQYAFERLQAMGLNVAWPSGGFFFWVPVWQDGWSGRDLADRLLREQQVQVTPGDLFGPSGLGYIRISYATDDGRLREGLTRLSQRFREEPVERTKQAA